MAKARAERRVSKTATNSRRATATRANGAGERTWQQTKSRRTRTAILDAAVDCFYELGYLNTTTEHIARKAAVSRGAMLHHFATRFDLITAAVDHINQIRLATFTREETEIQSGAEHSRIEEGIDAYWRQLNTPAFIVFTELRVAARTDKDLERVLIPALKAYDKAWYEAVSKVFPDLALSEAFTRTLYMTQYLLEGMAIARATKGPKVPESMMLDWLKRELRRSYQDVLTTVKRAK
jgi:AcrR family transcriptional regulator